MKKLVYILSMLFIYATITYGQGITITIGTKTASAGETVTVPISVTNFNNIGAVSLKIQYNSAVLNYKGVLNQPSEGNFTANASGNEITIGWFSSTPLNLGNGKFLDLQFDYSGGNSDIDFIKSQSEVANGLGNPLVVDFVNGGILAGTITKLSLPQVTAVAGNNISVPISVENFQNVGAISLKINYDPTVLNFTGVTNEPKSGNFTYGANNGEITIGWFDATPLNIGNGNLVNLEFTYLGSTSNLSFNTADCEISNALGNPIYTEYSNGKITFDQSNAPQFKLGTITAEPGSNIVLPLNVEKIVNVGAISLKIDYDPSVLTYTGVDNAPKTGNFTVNAANGVLTIGWFDATALNIDNAKFVDLKFKYNGGVSNLAFNTANSEVSNINGVALNVVYTNGKVSPNQGSIPGVYLPKVQAIGGNDITIPLTVNNFQKVGAVSIKINYDQSILNYVGVENQPKDGNFTVNASGGVLSIGWFNANSFGKDSVKFVDLKFHYYGGNSDLTFNTAQSEISDTLANILFTNYTNGSISALKNTQPSVTLKNVTAAPGSSVVVPMIVNNFQNVGAISLKINYDPAVLSFTGVQNQPAAGNFTSNAAGGVITVGWFNTEAYGKDSVKFVDLKFDFIGGNSDITFNTSLSEVSNTLGTPLYTEYVNGSVKLQANSYPYVKIPNIAAKVGDTLTVPVNIKKFSDVGAISLKLQYSSAVLTYIGTANQPKEGNFTVNNSNGNIALGWFNTTALGIDSGKFVDLRFAYNGGGTPISFVSGQNEIAKTNGDAIAFVQYIDGSVNANVAPHFTVVLHDTTIKENQKLTFKYQASDDNLDSKLKFKAVSLPEGAVIDSLTGVMTWTPNYKQSGKYSVSVSVSDGVLSATSSTSVITVTNVDRPPVFTQSLNNPMIYKANRLYTFQFKAEDPDGTPVSYSFAGVAPALASFGRTTGLFSWDVSLDYVNKNPSITFVATSNGLSVKKTIDFVITEPEGVDEEYGTPKDYTLKQNYPNPFNPTTKIKYTIPVESKVVLRVYNLLGQQVAQLVNEVKPAGYYTVDFDASKLSSGVYLYKIEAKNFNVVRKMILLK